MKLQRSLRVVAMSVAAVAASLGVATAAQAAGSWDLIISTTDDNPGGRLWFGATGDVVQVCDVQADGKRAVASVYNSSGSLRYRFSASGHGVDGLSDLPVGGRQLSPLTATEFSPTAAR